MESKKKNILITGGSGFIGKNLIEHLSKNKKYKILAPKHKELELLDESAVKDFFAKNKIDVVIHTAHFGGNRKLTPAECQDALKKNLKMFFNISSNSKNYGKMIFFGSGAEYDKSQNIKKVKEEEFGKHMPGDDYGFAKFVCSKHIEKADNIVCLRSFGVFGKYEDYETRFISNIMCRILYGLPVEINQNMLLDYVYVDDLCRIIEHLIDNEPKHKFYNIGSGKHIDLLSIAKKIKEISGNDSKIKINKKGMNSEYTCDNSRLMKEMPSFKFTPIEESLRELYAWYKANKESIKEDNLLKY
jgi:GDP-L-fucose synthase